MKSMYLLFLITLFISCKKVQPVDVSMKEDVMVLASDSLQGRQTGTSYEVMAADYIANRFKKHY